MENLSTDQYQTVLKYMETVNLEDFQEAVNILTRYNFNLQPALNARFNPPANNIPQQQQQQDDGVVRKYIEYLYRKHQNTSIFKSIYSFIFNTFRGLFRCIAYYTCKQFVTLVPQFIKKITINSSFANLYKKDIQVNFLDETLQRFLKYARNYQQKSCILIISQKVVHNCLIDFLNRREITQAINNNFCLSGLVQGQPDYIKIQGNNNPPTIVVIRENIFEEIEIIHRFTGQTQIRNITIQKLNQCFQREKALQRRDRNIVVKYRNYIRRNYYGPNSIYYEEDQQQAPVLNRGVSSQMIRQQNNTYRQIEEQAKRKRQLEEQEKRIQNQKQKQWVELLEQRKARKMSIPQQPKQGKIIRINFRCPDGSMQNRNFSTDDKIDLVYNWVQTNEQIIFEQNQKRQFQLLASYPPAPLCDKKHLPLSQVFDTDQEKVMIREL